MSEKSERQAWIMPKSEQDAAVGRLPDASAGGEGSVIRAESLGALIDSEDLPAPWGVPSLGDTPPDELDRLGETPAGAPWTVQVNGVRLHGTGPVEFDIDAADFHRQTTE